MKIPTKIKFYSPESWVNLVKKFGVQAILKHRDYRELFYCYSLLLIEITSSGNCILMGKLLSSDDPFDIVFLQEEIHNAYRAGKRELKGSDGIWIQFKEIKNFVKKDKVDLNEWIDFVQREYLDKIEKSVKLNPPGGVLHLHNSFPFHPIKQSEFENFLMKLKIPKNFPYKYVSLTIEVVNDDGKNWRIITYQLYPVFKFVFDLNQGNYLNIKK